MDGKRQENGAHDQGEERREETSHIVKLRLSDDAYKMVKGIAEARNQDIAQVMASALIWQRWLQRERARGSKILVDRAGAVSEVQEVKQSE